MVKNGSKKHSGDTVKQIIILINLDKSQETIILSDSWVVKHTTTSEIEKLSYLDGSGGRKYLKKGPKTLIYLKLRNYPYLPLSTPI